MSTLVTARTAIVTYLQANLPANTKIFYENTVEIDLNAQPDLFLLCIIDMTDTVRKNFDLVALRERFGEVIIRVFVREGKGTAGALGMVDFFEGKLSDLSIGDITFGTVRPSRKIKQDGWLMQDLVVDFRFPG